LDQPGRHLYIAFDQDSNQPAHSQRVASPGAWKNAMGACLLVTFRHVDPDASTTIAT
jgi:hypothetical protein